ncbi:hypothetical protein LTR99_003115 [Exophiala xenobiotica]|uniref:Subtilisin-like serine protease n=1 Tax=Vermiconidia calcicola TaxID=1690605 RepID=A0AAV9QAT8_9PEZI|nr:hypothetical protein LTR92_005856 [Exophiala xenobiotica]KAK5531619.1 hypothetical protein LTR23_009896 [Chaetothyriales sp. CCFEE 6169]KAK5538781.1 hypothetical protein LTR25_004325 [Vermiconidia calcicola]KAK5212681.1 hypothetical protein LTR41_001627 [Exophiala xenobiotica]KAK5268181.1 hypothetical protein LTR96_006728 [Exophiala xenobiotica]
MTHAPFPHDHQLCSDLDVASPAGVTQHVPGHPTIPLSDLDALGRFLRKEFWAADLEAMASRLQKVQGRDIVVTEDPRLHLLWINNRIFIKPLPICLLSHSLWKSISLPQDASFAERLKIRRAAMGFLRTYRHLIQHESDLMIAQKDDLRLVPNKVNWAELSIFLADLELLEDSEASARYHYGEIRLSRLNFYAPILFGRFYYEHIPMQYGEYFARLYGPLLFIFAVVTTILNSMQVALAAKPEQESSGYYLWEIFYWFGVVTLLITVVVGCSLILLWVGMIANEWKFALKNRHKAQGQSMS